MKVKTPQKEVMILLVDDDVERYNIIENLVKDEIKTLEIDFYSRHEAEEYCKKQNWKIKI